MEQVGAGCKGSPKTITPVVFTNQLQGALPEYFVPESKISIILKNPEENKSLQQFMH